MEKVYLYEDSGGGLFLHRKGSDVVYANVEIMASYGATFEQDAYEIAEDRPITGDGVLKLPYSEVEPRILDRQLRPIAVWNDGRIERLAQPGRDGAMYLVPTRDADGSNAHLDSPAY
jgi:hypothetical protein